MIIACDLDNTLLYSYKHKQPNDICVEFINGKEQGYMAPNAYALLRDIIKKGFLLPVTTRSVEQYRRIQWPDGCDPQYALTTNGAILLKNSQIDDDWLIDSKNEVVPYLEEMTDLHARLSAQDKYIRCRIVDTMYLFAYCKKGVNVDECRQEHLGRTGLTVIASGQKLYFFPPNISKGTAVRKIRCTLAVEKLICAGDSNIDIPMLEQADLALVPSRYLAERLEGVNTKICEEHTSFSEFVLQTVLYLETEK